MSKIRRDLPNDEYQAAVGANNASATNVFATIADLVAGTANADAIVFDVKINQAGGINKGQAVYVNGADGTNILVGKADYSTEATSSKTLGLIITSAANNGMTKVIAEGSLKGTGSEPLDTSAANAGDPVWLGDDGNLIFGLTNKPYAPNHLVFIGIVVEANPTVGEIFVKIQNGFEIEELHDVDVKSNPPSDGDVLTYNVLTDLWENRPAVGSSTSVEGNVLLSGNASWSGTGMTFNVSELRYSIDGVIYSAGPTNVNLSVGDPSNPRFDAIIANDSSVISVLPGTPSANPLAPAIPGNAVLVQYVLVAANATTPSITNEFVYREGSSPDWVPLASAGAAPNLTANFSSATPTPFQGTECTLVSAPAYVSNKYIQFTKGSGSIARANYPFLSIRIRLSASIGTRNITIQLFNGNTALATAVSATAWGLNTTLINTWQLVVIPLTAFNSPTITTVSRVRFYFSGTTPTPISVAFDDIKFQSGFGPQTATATFDVLDNGTTIGDTAKLNFIDGIGTNVVVTDDPVNNKIDVKVDSTGVTTINTLSGDVTLSTGTGGGATSDFGIAVIGNIISFVLPTASPSKRGALSSADWSTFNNKLDQAYTLIEEESASLTPRFILSFQGAGVTAYDDAINSRTVVNIPGAVGNTTYYLNQSINQTPYKEFSSISSGAAQQSITQVVAASSSATIASFQTPTGVPNTTNIPGGLWSFYLHFSGVGGNTWNINVEVYKRDSGGTETLLLTTDTIFVTTLSPTPSMILTDGVFPATTVLTTDRIVIKVKVANTDPSDSQGITFYTEGSTNYSVATTTLNQTVQTGAVTAVTGTSPIVSSGGTTPAISIPQANGTTAGYLSAADWNTFNNKQNNVTSGIAGNTVYLANNFV
jgi:hypothetical protein